MWNSTCPMPKPLQPKGVSFLRPRPIKARWVCLYYQYAQMQRRYVHSTRCTAILSSLIWIHSLNHCWDSSQRVTRHFYRSLCACYEQIAPPNSIISILSGIFQVYLYIHIPSPHCGRSGPEDSHPAAQKICAISRFEGSNTIMICTTLLGHLINFSSSDHLVSTLSHAQYSISPSYSIT